MTQNIFQQAGNVLFSLAQGVPGEMAYDGPKRSFPYTLTSNPNPNIVGATAYTVVSEGVAMAGGVGVFAGVLVNPKVYANYGVPGAVGGALQATMTIPDDIVGELATTMIVYLTLASAGAVGDQIVFSQATGALDRIAAGVAAPGGMTIIPRAEIILRASAAGGVAIVQLQS